jgi:hypothetical protein
MKIGSSIWRLFNYGPMALLIYSFERFSNKPDTSPKFSELNSIGLILNIENKNLWNEEMNLLICQKANVLRTSLLNQEVKNVFDNLTITRIAVVGALLNTRKFDAVVETGTQNGISISLINFIRDLINFDFQIFTVDVASMPKIFEKNVKYIKLKWPARYHFKKFFKYKTWNNTIFFHDSDHSKENMIFEYKYAWQKMKVAAIVSDDVLQNDAFMSFSKSINHLPLYFKLDSGPVVGLIIRRCI